LLPPTAYHHYHIKRESLCQEIYSNQPPAGTTASGVQHLLPPVQQMQQAPVQRARTPWRHPRRRLH